MNLRFQAFRVLAGLCLLPTCMLASAATAVITGINGQPAPSGTAVPFVTSIEVSLDTLLTVNVGIYGVGPEGYKCHAGARNVTNKTSVSIPMNEPGFARCFAATEGFVKNFDVVADLMDCSRMTYPDFACAHMETHFALRVGTTAAPPPVALHCSISPAASSHFVGTSVTLTATCDQPDVSYVWSGCVGAGNTCVANSAAMWLATYGLQASVTGMVVHFTATIAWSYPPAVPWPGRVPVVEFYHRALDHYFVSADAGEIAALDASQLSGWARTGIGFAGFAANAAAPDGSTPVCRFYGDPKAGLDSHFYSASPVECAAVRAHFPAWIFESASVFRVFMPDSNTGICPAGTMPIYRAFNGRADVNHRYTHDYTVLRQMVAKGYVAEGYGDPPVAMCAPFL